MIEGRERRQEGDGQVYVAHAQFLQTRLERLRHVLDVRQDLGDDVELLARDAGVRDRGPQLGLGLVDFGAVEVVVAEPDGHLGTGDAGFVELRLVAGFVPGCAGAVGELRGFFVSLGGELGMGSWVV